MTTGTAVGRGLCAVAALLLWACGGQAGGGDDPSGAAGSGGPSAGTGDASKDGAGGAGLDTASAGTTAGGGGLDAPIAGSGGAGGDSGGSGGAGCTGAGCPGVDECAEPGMNDCGSATCVDLDEGFECTCAGGAVFEAGACACDLVGTFAVRTLAQLSWEQALFGVDVVIAAGSAESVGYGLLTITRDGGALRAESRSCGNETPDLCSPAFMEAYGQGFPDSIWDGATMPTQSVTLDLASEAPGAGFETAPVAAFLGLRFASGVDPLGAFPVSALDPSLVWSDDDDDGALGVTTLVTEPGISSDRCSYPYAYLPVDATLSRAKEIHLGARTISHIEGTIDDCDTLTGKLHTDSVNGRVYGCTRVDDLPCDPVQAAFLDMHAKGQDIGTADFVMVRLDEATPTCADAHQASFPD